MPMRGSMMHSRMMPMTTESTPTSAGSMMDKKRSSRWGGILLIDARQPRQSLLH